jgi:hypothetical protein
VQITLFDSTITDGNLHLQRSGQAEGDRSLHLCHNCIWVDRDTAIDSAGNPMTHFGFSKSDDDASVGIDSDPGIGSERHRRGSCRIGVPAHAAQYKTAASGHAQLQDRSTLLKEICWHHDCPLYGFHRNGSSVADARSTCCPL